MGLGDASFPGLAFSKEIMGAMAKRLTRKRFATFRLQVELLEVRNLLNGDPAALLIQLRPDLEDAAAGLFAN